MVVGGGPGAPGLDDRLIAGRLGRRGPGGRQLLVKVEHAAGWLGGPGSLNLGDFITESHIAVHDANRLFPIESGPPRPKDVGQSADLPRWRERFGSVAVS